MRKAFSLITAIFIIVLMSTVAALVFNLSGKIVSNTTTQYRKEQAVLLAKSYTEYAILAIQGHNMAANGCLRTIGGAINYTDIDGSIQAGGSNSGAGYRVTVRLRYIGLPAGIVCGANYATNNIGNPSVLVDVNIRYKDLNNALLFSTATRGQVPWVNYNRRTLQRL